MSLMAKIKARLNESQGDEKVEVLISVAESDVSKFEEHLESMGALVENDEVDDGKYKVILPESEFESFSESISDIFENVVVESKDDKDMDDDKDDDKDMDDDKDDDDDKDKKEESSIADILAGVELEEGVATEIDTLFKAAVDVASNKKVEEKTVELEKEMNIELDKIHENVHKYLSYVSKEWLEENKVEVTNGLQLEFAQELISGIKTVFEDNYVEVPEDGLNLVDEMAQVNSDMETELDEAKNKIIELKASINENITKKIVSEISEDLTDTQKEKLSEMVDNSVEYISEDDFSSKVELLKTKYFTETDDDTDISEKANDDDLPNDVVRRKRYAKNLHKKSF